MGDTEYAWIQISDLHLFDNTELNTLKAAYNRLPHKEDVKFLVITGDLHQYKTDYSKTKKFLEDLLDIFDLKKSDIFIVPGNHDSGECDSKEAFTNYIETTVDKDQDCYRNYFVKGKLIDCFQKYNEFIKDFYGPLASSMYPEPEQTSVYKGYKQDKIEMRGDRAEMSDFPLYLNTVAGGLDCRNQAIGGFSFVVKIYALPVVEIIGQFLYLLGRYGFDAQIGYCF